MRWFRLRARLGSWLALSALTLQLVLAFGHVHLDRTAPLTHNAATAAAAVPNDPAAPDSPDGLADDYCAICALIHLAGSLVPTVAPALHLPVAFERSTFEPVVTAGLTASSLSLFQARAPPIA
jgi:hypothetical protein